MADEYRPDPRPTGPNTPDNPYYRRDQNVRIAREEETPAAFTGVAGTITGNPPVLSALSGGETLGANVTWGVYIGSGGVTTTQQMNRNNLGWVAYVGSTVVQAGDIWQVRELCTDLVTTDQPFTSASQLVITAIAGTGPVLATLVAGELLSANVTWGSYTGSGTVTATKQMNRNGGAWTAYVGTTEVVEGETWQVREICSDAGTTNLPFTSVAQTVAAAPPITGTAPVLATLLAGETLGDNVTWGSYSGTGTIGVSQQQQQNGGSWVAYNAASAMINGATWRIRELVSDDLVNNQEFYSEVQTVSTPVSAPAQITQWRLEALGVSEQVSVFIDVLPSNNGSIITDLQYLITGGSWASLGGADVGEYLVSNLTNGQQIAMSTRAVNAIGSGPGSTSKFATPYDAAAVPAVLSDLDYANDTLSVTTDTATGLIYYLLHDSVTPLDGPAIKAAVDGLTAVGGGTADPAAAGIIPIDWTEVTPGGYWINMVQETVNGFSNIEVLQATITAPVTGFDPASIAALMWDASDLTTLFQDTAGATPVTTTGQAVARLNNRGTKGGFFQNTGAADRPIYTVEGALKHLRFNGTDDYLRWVGADGSLALTGGYYLLAGLDDESTIAFNAFMSAAQPAGSSFNSPHGMMMPAGNVTNHSVGMNGGMTGAPGIEGYDTSAPGVRLPLSIVEIEVTPANGATNAWLRVRRVADPDVVEKATAAATTGQFPNVGTATGAMSLGSRILAGAPASFANYKLYCGVLILGAVTAQQKADCRAWVAERIGF